MPGTTVDNQAFEGFGDGNSREGRSLTRTYSAAIDAGKEMHIFEAKAEGAADEKVGKEKRLPVLHKFMAKFLEEDEKGDIFLVGTMIQQVAGMNQVGNDPKFHFNTFRFNDVSTTTDMLDVRRTMPVKGFGNRSTLNVRVPMTKSSIFSVMPYEVIKCECLVELQTSALEDGQTTYQVRPDLHVNFNDERELFLIRKGEELNNTDSYNMITEAPRIELIYDKGKRYCPKYSITFYIEKPFWFNLTSTILPIIAVVGLAALNVVNAESPTGPDLENSIALALTLVFLLPNLAPVGRGDTSTSYLSYLLSNTFMIFLLFGGLALASVQFRTWFEGVYEDDEFDYENNFIWGNLLARFPHPTQKDRDAGSGSGQMSIVSETVGGAGLIIMLMSLMIPLLNGLRYFWFKRQIVNSGMVEGPKGPRKAFVKDATFDQQDIVKKDGSINQKFLDQIVPLDVDEFGMEDKDGKDGKSAPQWVTTKDDKKERLVACGPVDPPK